jgi:hypothetical protein
MAPPLPPPPMMQTSQLQTPILSNTTNNLSSTHTNVSSARSSNLVLNSHHYHSSHQLEHKEKQPQVYSANFWENYERLCELQQVAPLQSIKSCLSVDGGANLTLNADKLK